MNHGQRVLAIARHGNASNHLALAIKFGHAAPFIGHEFHTGDVTYQHRDAFVTLEYQQLNVPLATQVAFAANHVLGFRHFHRPATDIAVGIANHLRDFHQGDAVGAQLDGVYGDLVGLHKAANRGHFGHAVRFAQLVAHVPILNGAQFGQCFVLGQQGILVHPAHARGIWADLRANAFGHARRGQVKVLQHPRTRPVDVGAIVKNNVDKGGTKEREPAHHSGVGH